MFHIITQTGIIMFDEKEQKHESFAMMSFNRIQCHGGQTLHGSDLKHNTIIEMNLHHSRVRRGLNHNWYYADKLIASVAMSQNQFSELITSMNMGDGIPVTLTHTERDGVIESPEFSNVDELHDDEFKETSKRVATDAIDMLATMKEIFAGSGTVKKADRNKMLHDMEMVVQDIVSNMPYMEKCFRETMDNIKTDAKSTIEAYYQHRVIDTGIKALNGEMPEAPKLIEDE